MTEKPQSHLDAAAQANRDTGVLLLCKEAAFTAIADSRLQRGHLRLLCAVLEHMNTRSAKAWPSRQTLADALGMSLKTVSNLLREIREYGYLVAGKEAVPEANNRKLTVYTFGNIDHDTIRREITAFVRRVRDACATQEQFPSQRELAVPVPAGSSRPSGNFNKKSSRPGGQEVPVPAGTVTHKKELSPYGDSSSRPSGNSQGAPTGADASASQPAPSLKTIIWQQGIAWLVHTYNGAVEEKEVRSRLGRLIKECGQGRVLDALGKAEEARPLDPLDYMTAMLQGTSAGGAGRADERARAEAIRKIKALS